VCRRAAAAAPLRGRGSGRLAERRVIVLFVLFVFCVKLFVFEPLVGEANG
jgi:hypothetical protein